MKDHWRDFLNFNKTERRGVFVLLSLVLVLLILNFTRPFDVFEMRDFSFWDSVVGRLTLDSSQTSSAYKTQSNQSFTRKNFDPNTTTFQEWISMGLKPYQANSILKYLAKGGSFETPEDLRKMYCLSSGECDILIPYIYIESMMKSGMEGSNYQSYSKPSPLPMYDLNHATLEDLIEIKGVGPATAKAILQYRDKLGGFHQVDQLKEVYLIDSTRYNLISKQCLPPTDSLRKIDLNHSDYYALKKHPYFSNRLAYELVQYKQLKGSFKTLNELRNVKGMNDSIFEKISPYLKIK